MSTVHLHPPCRSCGSLDTTQVEKNTWLCLGCKRQFNSPPEPLKGDLLEAIVLNKKKHEHASYFGQKENLLLEKTRLQEMVQKHLDRISHLEGIHLFADEIMDQCQRNEQDLLSQIKTLETREREQKVWVTQSKNGKLVVVKAPKISKEDELLAQMELALQANLDKLISQHLA